MIAAAALYVAAVASVVAVGITSPSPLSAALTLTATAVTMTLLIMRDTNRRAWWKPRSWSRTAAGSYATTTITAFLALPVAATLLVVVETFARTAWVPVLWLIVTQPVFFAAISPIVLHLTNKRHQVNMQGATVPVVQHLHAAPAPPGRSSNAATRTLPTAPRHSRTAENVTSP